MVARSIMGEEGDCEKAVSIAVITLKSDATMLIRTRRSRRERMVNSGGKALFWLSAVHKRAGLLCVDVLLKDVSPV